MATAEDANWHVHAAPGAETPASEARKSMKKPAAAMSARAAWAVRDADAETSAGRDMRTATAAAADSAERIENSPSRKCSRKRRQMPMKRDSRLATIAKAGPAATS
jgi:hypothetical protein